MKKGKFLVFEGIDGSGKTSQLHLLTQRLQGLGEACYETREPTDGPIGSLVNQILKKRLVVDERATATLFAGDRLDHLMNPHNGLCSKIQAGIHVVSDRYYLSSYAYNGTKAPLDWVIGLNEEATRILKPDAHIFVDVLPEVAVERIAANRYETELYETMENLTAVRRKFFDVFDRMQGEETIIVVDGNRSMEEVSEEIWAKVKGLFEEA